MPHKPQVLMDIDEVQSAREGVLIKFIGYVWPVIITPHTASMMYLHFMKRELIPVNIVERGLTYYEKKGLL